MVNIRVKKVHSAVSDLSGNGGIVIISKKSHHSSFSV